MDMNTENRTRTFYADPEGTLVIVCPACGYTKEIESKNVRIPKKPIKTKCPCGHVFTFQIELRQYHRKAVDLSGTCENVKYKESCQIRIQDLSMGGVKFARLGPMQLDVGDAIRLQFRIEDTRRTQLSRQAVVKFISGETVGANFTGTWFDKDLAFYLKA